MGDLSILHDDGTIYPVTEDEMKHIDATLDHRDMAYKDMMEYYLDTYDWHKRGIITKVRGIWTGEWAPRNASRRGVPNDMKGTYKGIRTPYPSLVTKMKERLRYTIASMPIDVNDDIISNDRESATTLATSDGYKIPLMIRGSRQVMKTRDILTDYIHGHRDNIHEVHNMFRVSKIHPRLITTILDIVEHERGHNVLIPVME